MCEARVRKIGSGDATRLSTRWVSQQANHGTELPEVFANFVKASVLYSENEGEDLHVPEKIFQPAGITWIRM
jgi:hypothetical protein